MIAIRPDLRLEYQAAFYIPNGRRICELIEEISQLTVMESTMDQNQSLPGVLRDLVQLALENADVRAGRLTDDEYRKHCAIVLGRVQKEPGEAPLTHSSDNASGTRPEVAQASSADSAWSSTG